MKKRNQVSSVFKCVLIGALFFMLVVIYTGAATAEEPLQPNDASDFNYVVRGDHVEIKSYVGTSQTVVVPEEIEGKAVTVVCLGRNEWENIPGFFPYVKKVILPSCVERLDDYCFARLVLLNEVIGLENVQSIGDKIFDASSMITEAHFSQNLREVSPYAFGGSYLNLQSIWIPNDIEIGYTFSLPLNLAELRLLPGRNAATIQIIDNMLFTADGKTLVCILPYKKEALCIIPEGTETIEESAYINRVELVTVVLPKTLTREWSS